jgi:hypothetical protein
VYDAIESHGFLLTNISLYSIFISSLAIKNDKNSFFGWKEYKKKEFVCQVKKSIKKG